MIDLINILAYLLNNTKQAKANQVKGLNALQASIERGKLLITTK